MLRYFGASLGARSLRAHALSIQLVRGISRQADETPNEDIIAARKWASALSEKTVPRSIARVRFDRASGKGGQHVNT
jgi:protein subunit release factor B